MNHIKQTHAFNKRDYTYSGATSESIVGLFPDINTFILPKSIARDITQLLRYKKAYGTISNDHREAIELCLYFVSNLTSTIFREDDNYWKALHSDILRSQNKNYKRVVELLKANNIIEVYEVNGEEVYTRNVKSKQYKLGDKYIKRLTSTYIIESRTIINIKSGLFYKTLNDTRNNPICDNLITIYPQITLPTVKQIKTEAKKLIKAGHTTNKGKILTVMNKHKRSYWKDAKNRSFVEESIELFDYLTSRGLMLPAPGSWESGGRVVDSFTLMPSWIRKMIKINGEQLVEADYSCLHPNIAETLYGGSRRHINHDIVSEYLGIDRKTAKIEHLSFFNKRWCQMQKSDLFKYYMDNEPLMMENIKQEKYNTSYKRTSQRLFKTEVGIMTEAIKELNENGVNAIYVYDALYVQPEFEEITKFIMNKVIVNNNINTKVG
jgi:hypothetical protein